MQSPQSLVETGQRVLQVGVEIQGSEQAVPSFEQFGSARRIPVAPPLLQQIHPVSAQFAAALLFGKGAAQLETHTIVGTGKHHVTLETNFMETLQANEQFFLAG